MDFWFHILLICIIGLFFFLDKFSESFNPMMFAIIFSMLGLFLLMNTNIEIVDYSVVNYNSTSSYYNVIEADDIGIGVVNLQSFFVIFYMWMLFLSSVNLVLGKKDSEERSKPYKEG